MIAQLYMAALSARQRWEQADRLVTTTAAILDAAACQVKGSDDVVKAMTVLRAAADDHCSAVKSSEFARRYYKEHESALLALR